MCRTRVAQLQGAAACTASERPTPQAFAGHSEGLVDGSQRVETDVEELSSAFTEDGPFSYVVSAEKGDMGISYRSSYRGLEISVDAVSSPDSEAMEVETLIARCGVGGGQKDGCAQELSPLLRAATRGCCLRSLTAHFPTCAPVSYTHLTLPTKSSLKRGSPSRSISVKSS